MKEIRDYRGLYLECDVLLLAGVFERFRNNSLKNYGLCPSHYSGAAVLSWNAMLNRTKVELEFIEDPCIYIFFVKDTRGGVSGISNRYSRSNNKYP